MIAKCAVSSKGQYDPPIGVCRRGRLYSRRIAAILGLVVALSIIAPVSAGIIYLKDGFAVHGKVQREMEMVIDPATGQAVPMFKATNQYIVTDHARYVILGPKQVESADKDTDIRDGQGVFQAAFARPGNKGRPAAAIIGQAGPFDNNKWERKVAITVFMVNPMGGPYLQSNTHVRQKVVTLSPYFMRLECLEYDWSAYYLTNEFGPDVILPLVRTHVAVTGKPGDKPDFEKQFRVFRFCSQAGWLENAGQELEKLRAEFPDEKERLALAEKGLKQLIEQRLWEDAELAAKCGRHTKAQELLARLRIAEMPPVLQKDAAALKAKYDALAARLAQTKQALAFCYGNVVGPPAPLIADALPVIQRQVNYDTLERLEPFATLGRQAELDAKAGRPTQYTRDQVLAAAISGWVIGPASAEASEDTAEHLWSARKQILALQRTVAPIDRSRKIADFEQTVHLSVDEVARVITQLPPPDDVDFADPRFAGPVERQTRPAFTANAAYKYTLLLPPEYHANRAYPVLIVLPTSGESTSGALARWQPEAARHGYILAAVDWGIEKNRYEFTVQEQDAALECIRDLKRYLQVDSDRVFLTGYAEGANAAIDIGLSHPDIFAGVAPINGRPRAYATQWYWRNSQNLPFYLVVGELSGDVRPWVAALFEPLAEKGYASLMVMYRGRPTDFFTAEVPNVFEWFDHKHRALGFPQLGRNPNNGTHGEEYHSFRTTDNSFYWITTDDVVEKYTLHDFTIKRAGTPAALQATIRENNQITAYTRGLKQLTLWLGRAYDAQTGARDMIDFAKPVRVQLNGRQNWSGNGKIIKPRLDVLLDDYCRRGDRRRLFFAKVEFDKVQ